MWVDWGGSAILIDLPTMPSRAALHAFARRAEADCVADLLRRVPLSPEAWGAACAQARQWIESLRGERSRGSGVDALMRQFSLSSQEGVALMCLAEALARIPDRATADALIRDKLAQGDWRSHIGASRSIFVNAAAWGLMVTGKLVATHSDAGLSAAVNRLVARGGEPLIRAGVDIAMRLLGQQFVLGRTIEQALARAQEAEQRGYRHSYDMLGEAALTADDAQRYWDSYAHAIAAIGASVASASAELAQRPGISVKLSALHPRFTSHQADRVQAELLPRIRELCRMARDAGIGLNIDAEESERLEPTLSLFAQLAADPGLAGWDGLGIVVQAYQKRAPAVVDWLAVLANEQGRRFMVRLVKGAYWDSEIKRAQVDGQADFPVYTRKAHTDLSYLVCAQRLLAHQDRIFAQFATHNALTLAAVLQLAAAARAGHFELQCLHGMGETLYDRVVGSQHLGLACRIYAPVGSHETLLAYLVRRLLENGANSSFVNRVVDEAVPIDALLEDPVTAGRLSGGQPHPAILLPAQLYAPARRNARGIDLYDVPTLTALEQSFRASASRAWTAFPILATDRFAPDAPEPQAVRNPARRSHVVGTVHGASVQDVETALLSAQSSAHLHGWGASDGARRAAVLEAVADAFEDRRDDLMWLAIAEAGKTVADAAGEVREAVDFCRYYAAQARALPADPGAALGTVVAISPWNFPLAIFAGQVSAALAAGNAVLAKPAEQTPLIAALAVRLMHGAGVPRASLQLLPGDGAVGARLTRDPRVRAVLFTGSTEVACLIDQALASFEADSEPVLVAETGGQNAMIVDSSAQPEQVVQDVLQSAFGSAGQRCSALRILCLQEEIAGPILAMLTGAAAQLRLGDPAELATDVGPVIDAAARDAIESHIRAFATPRILARVAPPPGSSALLRGGDFVAPAIIEINSLAELEREVFGPVLHVLRYRREALGELIAAINATGYGLTCGIHSRIDETIAFITARIRAGNIYVNRNMIGAVVGVQPFGGEGLSGTGPKAGGPWTVARLQRPRGVLSLAPLALGAARVAGAPAQLRELQAWLHESGHTALAALCDEYSVCTPIGCSFDLAGPTGETNVLQYRPRGRVLCLGDGDAPGDPAALLGQLAAVAATGNRALLLDAISARQVVARLPAAVRDRIDWAGADATAQEAGGSYALVLLAGAPDKTRDLARVLRRTLAQRAGARIPVLRAQQGRYAMDRMVAEQVVTINTAAAGGNANLMTLKPL
jgi:RHH-type proline utilization regulon transcriptional repressor/proline dehydrogenase/delta 1-pyrroline-5-carboxylate dehydrogenase